MDQDREQRTVVVSKDIGEGLIGYPDLMHGLIAVEKQRPQMKNPQKTPDEKNGRKEEKFFAAHFSPNAHGVRVAVSRFMEKRGRGNRLTAEARPLPGHGQAIAAR
jgi:hypothetical protein